MANQTQELNKKLKPLFSALLKTEAFQPIKVFVATQPEFIRKYPMKGAQRVHLLLSALRSNQYSWATLNDWVDQGNIEPVSTVEEAKKLLSSFPEYVEVQSLLSAIQWMRRIIPVAIASDQILVDDWLKLLDLWSSFDESSQYSTENITDKDKQLVIQVINEIKSMVPNLHKVVLKRRPKNSREMFVRQALEVAGSQEVWTIEKVAKEMVKYWVDLEMKEGTETVALEYWHSMASPLIKTREEYAKWLGAILGEVFKAVKASPDSTTANSILEDGPWLECIEPLWKPFKKEHKESGYCLKNGETLGTFLIKSCIESLKTFSTHDVKKMINWVGMSQTPLMGWCWNQDGKNMIWESPANKQGETIRSIVEEAMKDNQILGLAAAVMLWDENEAPPQHWLTEAVVYSNAQDRPKIKAIIDILDKDHGYNAVFSFNRRHFDIEILNVMLKELELGDSKLLDWGVELIQECYASEVSVTDKLSTRKRYNELSAEDKINLLALSLVAASGNTMYNHFSKILNELKDNKDYTEQGLNSQRKRIKEHLFGQLGLPFSITKVQLPPGSGCSISNILLGRACDTLQGYEFPELLDLFTNAMKTSIFHGSEDVAVSKTKVRAKVRM